MGCGSSIAAKAKGKEIQKKQDVNKTPRPNSRQKENPSEAPKATPLKPNPSDPVLQTFNDMLPILQQKKIQKVEGIATDTLEIRLPGIPDNKGPPPPPPEDEMDENLTPEEKQAIKTAEAVVQEIRKQVQAGREIAQDVTISTEKRLAAAQAADELGQCGPSVVHATREAFDNPEAQKRLRDLIKRISELNQIIEDALKPDNELLVLPRDKYNDRGEAVDTQTPQQEDDIQKFKRAAQARYDKVKSKDQGKNEKRLAPRKSTSMQADADDESKPWRKDRDKLVTKRKKFSNGDVYHGQFNTRGQQHGEGEYQFANGDYYKGQFRNGKFHGKGLFKGADGDVYEGEFKDDLFHGQGVLVDGNTGDRYEGEFENGVRSGKGVYEYASGERYEGEFLKGEKHGFGKFTSADGLTIYTGTYHEGKRHGEGELIQKGSRYKGQFSRGKMHGTGRLEFENGNVYEGEFREGEMGPKGTFTFKTGNKFEGTINPDGTFGTGVMTFTSGDVYSGTFQGRKPHGKGYLIHHKTGETYEGDFADGKKHGKGRLTKPNGEVLEGDFVNNKASAVTSYH